MANVLEYIKTIWKAGREGGTAWTPARLNNIEDGIEQATQQINTNSADIETIGKEIGEINSNLLKYEMGYTTVTLSNGIGKIDFSSKFSSITSCIINQIYNNYVVQYCKPSGNCIEFKISNLAGNVDSYTYGINYIVCGVPL